MRILLTISALLLLPLVLKAQNPEVPVVSLLLPAVGPPPQSLRYVLLPEARDRTPGNAAQTYYRAFSPEWWGEIQRDKEFQKKLESWGKMTPEDLKVSDAVRMKNFRALTEVDRAARKVYCDWELLERLKEDGAALLLPDLQSMRLFANLLSIRARLEMADGDFDKAVYTLQTCFALAKHNGEGPTLIHSLVGIAIAGVALNRMEELIQNPKGPNLYWALATLPRGLIDMRHGIQGEGLLFFSIIPDLRELEKEAYTPEKANAILSDVMMKLKQWTGNPEEKKEPGFMERFMAAGFVAVAYAGSKERLLSQGFPPEKLKAMPNVQVVMIDIIRQFNKVRDNHFKSFYLPYHEAAPLLKQSDAELKKLVEDNRQNVLLVLLSQLLPAVDRVAFASARLERRIAILRTIEAIRIYASTHQGKLPGKLADITEVPVPLDPVTNTPFSYNMTNEVALLTAPPPQGEKPTASNNVKYELRIRK